MKKKKDFNNRKNKQKEQIVIRVVILINNLNELKEAEYDLVIKIFLQEKS